MKMTGLLIALLVVGWFVYGQLQLIAPPPVIDGETAAPTMPGTQQQQQLQQFDQDINQIITDSAAERARQIEENQ
jgi:hypothetical protein